MATEVKELAKQTARATEEITGQVEAIQNQVEDALGGLNDINETLGSMQSISEQISERVGEQVRATEQIGSGLAR